MSRIISIFNMKGGVGKTTTAYNIAHGLARFHNQRILLIDIDPQGHSSASLGIKIENLTLQLKDVLLRKKALQEIIISLSALMSVAPSNILLAEDEIPISGLPGRELILRKAVASLQNQYDFILIDCPPNIGVFSINALMASHEVIIPVDMSYLGLLGLSSVEKALHLVHSALEHPIEIAGVLATRFDIRNNLSSDVLKSLKQRFSDHMYHTVIPESVKLREAPSFALPIFDHDPKGQGAKAYYSLVEEIVQ